MKPAITRTDNVPGTEIELRNPSGLHARPAALFVETARRFSADVRVANLNRNPKRIASARSLLAVLALGISRGHTMRIDAQGADAERAISALRELVESGLGEALEPSGQS
jgi:phosphotransferase system HPr (HPr) family protein